MSSALTHSESSARGSSYDGVRYFAARWRDEQEARGRSTRFCRSANSHDRGTAPHGITGTCCGGGSAASTKQPGCFCGRRCFGRSRAAFAEMEEAMGALDPTELRGVPTATAPPTSQPVRPPDVSDVGQVAPDD